MRRQARVLTRIRRCRAKNACQFGHVTIDPHQRVRKRVRIRLSQNNAGIIIDQIDRKQRRNTGHAPDGTISGHHRDACAGHRICRNTKARDAIVHHAALTQTHDTAVAADRDLRGIPQRIDCGAGADTSRATDCEIHVQAWFLFRTTAQGNRVHRPRRHQHGTCRHDITAARRYTNGRCAAVADQQRGGIERRIAHARACNTSRQRGRARNSIAA